MSLKTWLDEFYPIPAAKVSKEDALEHSIRKWKGLLPENLEKHQVVYQWEELQSQNEEELIQPLPISSSSCALCQHWYDDESGCPECPLVKAGNNCCEDYDSAWRERYNNPARMVEELERSRASV